MYLFNDQAHLNCTIFHSLEFGIIASELCSASITLVRLWLDMCFFKGHMETWFCSVISTAIYA